MKTTETIETNNVSHSVANRITNKPSGLSVMNIIQTKLTVGLPGDQYEQEADRMADQVMSKPAPKTIQPTCNACHEDETVRMKFLSVSRTPWSQTQLEEEEEPLQKKLDNHSTPETVSDQAHEKINYTKGLGNRLPDDTKSFMETRFDSDFSSVRVHNNVDAFQLNHELGAQAFTVGDDIYFNSGKYNPDSTSGKRLLAHELTHVVQQQPRLSRSPDWEGTTRFQEQLDYTPDSKDIEELKNHKTPRSFDEKVEKTLVKNNLVNAFFRGQMRLALTEFHAKENIIFEAGVRYLYTLSGRFSEDEIRWIRIIMHSPKLVEEYDYDLSKAVKPSMRSSVERDSEERQEETDSASTYEEAVALYENAGNNVEKLDGWLAIAEYVLEGNTAEQIGELREELNNVSESFSKAVDIVKKTEIGIKLFNDLNRGLNIKPGGAGSARAAANILATLGELGEEIDKLGIFKPVTEALKMAPRLVGAVEEAWQKRIPEYRSAALREAPTF